VRWLNRAYEGFAWPGSNKPSCTFQLAASHALLGTPSFSPGVVLYLYRVVPNEHARHSPRDTLAGRARPPLSLDLHYLVFPWVELASDEAYLIAWTMRMLESRPVLGPGDLADGGFREDEVVHVIPGELNNEDLMRIWDAIEPPYRLSVPYIARVVQIDLEPMPEARPVIARKLVFEQMGTSEPDSGGGP
jgi:hypothetical protein